MGIIIGTLIAQGLAFVIAKKLENSTDYKLPVGKYKNRYK